MKRRMVGFHQDEEQHWVAELECGHNQHVRHHSPWSDRPRPSVTVMGSPVRAWKMPPSFHPPRMAFVTPDHSEPHLRPLPHGSSYAAEKMKLWRTSWNMGPHSASGS